MYKADDSDTHGERWYLSPSRDKQKNQTLFRDFVHSNQCWQSLLTYLNSKEFITSILDLWCNVDCDPAVSFTQFSLVQRAKFAITTGNLNYLTNNPNRLHTTVTLSSLPFGGGLIPHSDGKDKLVTLLFAMNNPANWDPSLGGHTAICEAINPLKSFNRINYSLEFNEVVNTRLIEHRPNNLVMFLKTHNSLHSVPIVPESTNFPYRQSLLVNIYKR